MRGSERNFKGDLVRLKLQGLDEVLSWNLTDPQALLGGLIYERSTLGFMVEDEVHHRTFAMLVACSVAKASDLGPFKGGRGAHVVYVSGSGDEKSDQHRLMSIANTLGETELGMLVQNMHIYHRGREHDEVVDLATESGQELIGKSLPETTNLVIFDFLPAFSPSGKYRAADRILIRTWFRFLNSIGIAVVYFDRGEHRRYSGRGEHQSESIAFLTSDPSAPTQFGDGFILHRRRINDDDTMPRRVSFYHTEIDGIFDFGFAVPDDEDTASAATTRILERQIKVGKMKLAGMKQKDIATALRVHEATVSNDLKAIREAEAASSAAYAKSQLNPANRWGDAAKVRIPVHRDQ